MTEYLRPGTLGAALEARRDHPGYLLLGGGTDLLVGALERPAPEGVIDLFGLGDLTGVGRADDGGVRVKAMTTYAQLLRSDLVRRELPALWEASREVGAVQIQERGTLAGNVATSSPVGDTLPVLLALDAQVELSSAGAARAVPYHQLCTGYRTIDLRPDELITGFRFPPECADTKQYWRKVGTRRAQAISKVMVACAARLDAQGAIAHVRVALGAVADRPVRSPSAEAALLGATPGDAAADAVRAGVAADITPISDVRSTKDYRLQVAQNLVARFVLQLA